MSKDKGIICIYKEGLDLDLKIRGLDIEEAKKILEAIIEQLSNEGMD
jgi:dsDNA-specific endonuclease/ATPase MutS2